MKIFKKFNNKNLFIFIAVGIFLVLSVFLIINHEFWRDEVRSWHLGLESQTLSDLFNVTRVSEGTPSFWYIILYFISHYLTQNIEVMKVIHLGISTVSVFLFLKYSPFNNIIKILFIFGYYPFYEYSIISRNYALGILLTFIFCVLYKNKFKNIIPIGTLLFFMTQVDSYSLILSIIFFILVILDLSLYERKNKRYVFELSLLILIFMAGIIFAIWQLYPQINSSGYMSMANAIDSFLTHDKNFLVNTIDSIIKGFLPFPKIESTFWNTNLFVYLLSEFSIYYKMSLAALLLIISFLLIKRKYLIPFISVSVLLILSFFVYKIEHYRHVGHIFIYFFCFLWLSEYYKDGNYIVKMRKSLFQKIFNAFLTFILLVSLGGTIIAYYYDYKLPFSNGKNVASYIEKKYNEDYVIIGYQDYTSETVAGYLDKKIYYPESDRFSKLVKWDNRSFVDNKDLLKKIFYFFDNGNKVLLILDEKTIEFKKMLDCFNGNVVKFDNSINNSENFFVYDFNKNLKLIKEISYSNFEKFFTPLNDCIFEIKDERILIRVLGNDPYFESNFPINFSDTNSMLILINLHSNINADLKIYYKLRNSEYNEKDSEGFNLKAGENIICIEIPHNESIEKLRIDPINIKSDCTIEFIKVYNKKIR